MKILIICWLVLALYAASLAITVSDWITLFCAVGSGVSVVWPQRKRRKLL